ncbi:hypothetical protein LTS18_008575, partial [Coniosporium uncinatum]
TSRAPAASSKAKTRKQNQSQSDYEASQNLASTSLSGKRTTRASAAAANQQRTVYEDASERNGETYNQFEESVVDLPKDVGSQLHAANTVDVDEYEAQGTDDQPKVFVAPPASICQNAVISLSKAAVEPDMAVGQEEHKPELCTATGNETRILLGNLQDDSIQVPSVRRENDEASEGPRSTSPCPNAAAPPRRRTSKEDNADLNAFKKVHGSKQSQTAEARQTRGDVDLLVDEGIVRKVGIVQFSSRGPVNQGGTLLRKHAIVSSSTKVLRERETQSRTPEDGTSPLDRFNKPSKAQAANEALMEAMTGGDPQLQEFPGDASAHRAHQRPRKTEEKKALITPNQKTPSSEQGYFAHVASKKRPAGNDELHTQREAKRRRPSARTGDSVGDDPCHVSKPSRRVSSTYVDRQGSPLAVAVFEQQQNLMAGSEKTRQEQLEELSNQMDLAEEITLLPEEEDVALAEAPAPFQANTKLTPDEPKAPSAAFTIADEAYVKKLRIVEEKNNELFNPFKVKRQPSDTPFLNRLKEKVKAVKVQKASPSAQGALDGSGPICENIQHFEDPDKTLVEEAEEQRPIISRPQAKNAVRRTMSQSSSSSTSQSNSQGLNTQEHARQEQMEWEASLDPFRRTVFDAILHIARRVVDGLGSPQAAARAAVEDFERDGQALNQACFEEWNEAYIQYGLDLEKVVHTVGGAFVAWQERDNAGEGYEYIDEDDPGPQRGNGQELEETMTLWHQTEEVAKAAIEELIRKSGL